jgi:HSP20 family protein
MSIVRWEPFSDLMSLREAMDRLFEESVVRPGSRLMTPYGAASELALDVYETDNDLVVTAALPGVNPEDVDITITGDALCIKGETKSESKVEKANYLRQERRYGAFARTIALQTPVQADKAEAKFKDGVLTLSIPKAEEAKPKSIKVKTETN